LSSAVARSDAGGAPQSLTALAISRLTRAMGQTVGLGLAQEALALLGLTELRTPNDLLAFANILIKKGGLAEIVGSTLKVTAHLRGARDR
jgi:hypothetical protein